MAEINPDPAAALRDQLWRAVVFVSDTSPDNITDVANEIVDALEPVIWQVVARELRKLANQAADKGERQTALATLAGVVAESDYAARVREMTHAYEHADRELVTLQRTVRDYLRADPGSDEVMEAYARLHELTGVPLPTRP